MDQAADIARPEPVAYALQIAIRPYRPASDQGFLYRNWIMSLASQPPYRDLVEPENAADEERPRRRGLDRNWYAAAQHALIASLLERPSVQVLCAVEPGHDDHLIGFIVCEPRPGRVVHWLYVKKGTKGVAGGLGFRYAGVATRLMAAAFGERGLEPITCSIRTATGTAVASKWLERWRITFRSAHLGKEQPR